MHPLLADLAARGEGLALRVGDERLSYGELERRARVHAAWLRGHGVAPGDAVAVWAEPEPDAVVAMVGNALLGVATVPLNPALGERELEHLLRDAAPRRVVAARPERFATRTPGVAEVPRQGPMVELPRVSPSDVGFVLYTSGTTGPPKGAPMTFGACAFDIDALADAWDWTARDQLVHALPLFHVHGLVLGLFGSLRVGAAVQLLPRFSPEGVCAAMGDGGTLLFAVPTMYHRMAEHGEASPEDARRLAGARLLVSGSAGLPVRESERILRLFGQRVVSRYGLTETLIITAARHDGPRHPDTVGPPLPGLELRIVDESGADVVPGSEALGEVWVRGPSVFSGYLHRPEATAAALDGEGFFHTGDVASFTASGEVRIVGRKATDLIKSGGYKVGAGEVEAALLEHAAVREAAVLGVPDEDLGERIVAFVVAAERATPTAKELIEHVATLLAPHKRPREVHLVPSLPRNAMGKVQKAHLRRSR